MNAKTALLALTATLYLPGQAARPVELSANTAEAAAAHLGLPVHLVDVLAGGSIPTEGLALAAGYTVYAHGDIDESTPFNEAATEQLDMLLGEWCEVCGPVLIVKA